VKVALLLNPDEVCAILRVMDVRLWERLKFNAVPDWGLSLTFPTNLLL
jgi:hypothetical protein